jgi:sec-independent protein translocase protein TatA
MDALVGAQIEEVDGLPGHRPWRVLTDEGQDGAVVVGVVVQVEKLLLRGIGEELQHVRPASFADVDNAFQHPSILHYPPEGSGGTVGRMGAQEWLIIAVVVLVLFGGSQLPKLARSLGEAQKEFKKGVTDVNKDEPSAKSEQSTKTEQSAKPADDA